MKTARFLNMCAAVILCPVCTVLASTVAYWQFDDADGGLYNASVGAAATFDLVEGGAFAGNAFDPSVPFAVNPLPNPDGTAGFEGNPSQNSGSLYSTGSLQKYLATSGDGSTALNLDGSSAWTFEGWYELHSAPSFNMIWATRDTASFVGMHLAVTGAGHVSLYVDDGPDFQDITWGTTLNQTDVWKHVALTFDGSLGTNGRFEFFVDGVSLGSQDLLATVNRGTVDTGDVGELRLAGRAAGNNSLPGRLDEWRISDRVLSSSEFIAVPEPSPIILVLIGGGLGFLALRGRARTRRSFPRG